MAFNKTSTVAAIVEVLSELYDILTLKELQKMALKAFLMRWNCFALLLSGFGKSCITHCSAYWVATG